MPHCQEEDCQRSIKDTHRRRSEKTCQPSCLQLACRLIGRPVAPESSSTSARPSPPQKSMSPHHRAHSRTGELIAEPENPSPRQRASSSPHRTRQQFFINSYFLFLDLCLIFQSSVNRNPSPGLRASHQEASTGRARGLNVAELVASGCRRRHSRSFEG